MEIPIFDTKFGQKLLIGLKIWSTLQILVRNLVKNSNFGWKIWLEIHDSVENLVKNAKFS